jgi:hypothetical protein
MMTAAFLSELSNRLRDKNPVNKQLADEPDNIRKEIRSARSPGDSTLLIPYGSVTSAAADQASCVWRLLP